MSAQVAVTSSAPSRAAAPRRPNTHPRALLPTRRSKFANGGKIFRASKVVVRRSATVDAPKVVAVTNVVRGSRPGYVTFRGGSTGSISFKAVSAPEDVSTALPGRAYESMTIGVPKESFKGERRVAMAPETCGKLVKAGFNVNVEKNAGVESEYSDEDYAKEGCRIVNDAWKDVDIIAKIRPPSKS